MPFLIIFVTCRLVMFHVQSFNKYFIEKGHEVLSMVTINTENNRGHFETGTILLATSICSYLPLHEIENLKITQNKKLLSILPYIEHYCVWVKSLWR